MKTVSVSKGVGQLILINQARHFKLIIKNNTILYFQYKHIHIRTCASEIPKTLTLVLVYNLHK